MIHKLSLIDPLAKIDDGVTIGPYSVIGPEVEIGKKFNNSLPRCNRRSN